MENPQMELEALQALLQTQSVTTSVRVVALLSALALFGCVFEAVRRRKLREELTPIWLTWAAAILVLSLSFDLLIWLTGLIGAWTPSAAVFFFGLGFLTAISLHYGIRLSSLTDQVRMLGQEIALIRASQDATYADPDAE